MQEINQAIGGKIMQVAATKLGQNFDRGLQGVPPFSWA
jgi:hypothetical protein